MKHVNLQRLLKRMLGVAMLVSAALSSMGCEVDSFFDPSRTGRFEMYPTSINVLDRIDAIEHDSGYFSRATLVQPEDLVPSELSYYLYPGDTVTLSIFELYQPGTWASTTRRIDAGGFYRVSEIGDVRAAGLTPQQFEAEVKRQLEEKVMKNPQVDVVVESAGGLRYTVYGYVQTPGVFTLVNPDMRLLDALAIAGGAPVTTERVFVIRTVPLTEEQRPSFVPSRNEPSTGPSTRPEVNIEDIIRNLPNQQSNRPSVPPENPPRPMPAPETAPKPDVRPGMMSDAAPQQPATRPDRPIDIDELQPTKVQPQQPPVDIEETRPPRPPEDASGDTFIYVPERGEWVRVRGEGANRQVPAGSQPDVRTMVRERIIQIDYQRLAKGDSSQNIVIRPDDRIYIDGPEQGLIYLDGEVIRPGVYALPITGSLTLSRAITAAGGLGPIAIPERVDLTRKVGPKREATIRLDLAAIRQRTEPDVVLRADDQIIVGTSFWATPLAVFRNGFRVTYGFGFVLDRNFAEDVFNVRVVQ